MEMLKIWNLLKFDLDRETIKGTELYNVVEDGACSKYFEDKLPNSNLLPIRPAVKWFTKSKEYFAEIDRTFCVGVRFPSNPEASEALSKLREAGITCRMDRDMKTIFTYISKNDYKRAKVEEESEMPDGTDFVAYSNSARETLQKYQEVLESEK
ncbi:NAD-dependent epimerase/dehydratase family protein [Vibrio phage Va2]|nr:NAD-dependent epimerase/dehydratase family protein [Vibrio phage Va2]